MGCSPSKGKLFSKPEGPAPQKALLSQPSQAGVSSSPVQEDSKCVKTNKNDQDLPLSTEEQPLKEWPELISDPKDVEQTGVNTLPPDLDENVASTVLMTKKEKRKKNKSRKRSEKQKSSIGRVKVDFPPMMVRAHQAAYAFLNPNISKYETLLGLLDQAAQTQLSLQPMMSALVMRFEEINQALEEMAEEGELMMKEHGDYMAMPSGMLGPTVMKAKSNSTTNSPPHSPPDLLQQLLKHSTEKMRLVSGSAQALGDTTLEEAVEYYSSLSKLLVGKLRNKQAAERRLAQVLAHVEAAATRKSNPEDSALHSEDSGIGGENESLTGSERHRHHRGSAGSGSCGSGNNVRCTLDNLASNLPNLVDQNEDDEDEEEEEEEEEDDEDDENEDDDGGEGPERKRSNSSPPDPSQTLLFMCESYIKAQPPTVKRPVTAATTSGHLSSSRCVNIMMELQRSQRDLDQRIKKMAELRGCKSLARPHNHLCADWDRRHSLSGSTCAQKGPLRTGQLPSLPSSTPQPTRRQTVRRLINTFSQGVDGRPGQTLANVPPHIRRPRKSGTVSDAANVEGFVINGNNNNNSWPDGRDDLDVENLPPPPPEVLMDNSFQSSEGVPGNGERVQDNLVHALPVIQQNTGGSKRLRVSMQNVEVLPNRASVKPTSVRQDAVMAGQEAEKNTDNDLNLEKTNCLYQQARKIIHLRNAAESDKRDLVELSGRRPTPPQTRTGQRYEGNECYTGEMSSFSPPVTAPPVSRVRLPPSCPSVGQRFPSPPVFRPQTASQPSSRPGSPRSVTRAGDNEPENIIPSVSFRDARSVFCVKEPLSAQGGISLRPAGEGFRGRRPMRGTDNYSRRTQSEQRPGLSSNSDGGFAFSHTKDSDSAKHRSTNFLIIADNQLDPSASESTA